LEENKNNKLLEFEPKKVILLDAFENKTLAELKLFEFQLYLIIELSYKGSPFFYKDYEK
jgi:hypothetical protein